MLISIIIPAYNVSSYIEECIHSAFAQTYPHIEVICIDNNSSDDTWQKLEQLKQQYPQLIIDKEPKPGAPAARNRGLKLSQGEWIQFLDADDILKPHKLERQIETIKNSKSKPSFVIGGHEYHYSSKKRKIINNINTKQNIWTALAEVKSGNTCANLFNKKNLISVKGWNEKLKSSQEYDLMFRLLKTNPTVLYCKSIDTIIRQVETSITNNTNNIVSNIQRRIEHIGKILNHVEIIEIPNNEITQIKHALFSVIKEQFTYDPGKSVMNYKKYFEDGFKPHAYPGITKKYCTLHNLLGFKLTNKIIRTIKK